MTARGLIIAAPHSGAGKTTVTIAILAAHYGRNKLFNYYGPLDSIDIKGIQGPVTVNLDETQSMPVTGMRWHASAG